MSSADKSKATPAASQYAKPDTSDREELKGRVMACLRDRNTDLRGIHVTVFGGTVAIRGHVRSSQEKQLCVECCRNVPGVARVVDDLIVVTDAPVSHGSEGEMS
jgi:osmotically-inducible protein OsmY